jgi:hypothetical protein
VKNFISHISRNKKFLLPQGYLRTTVCYLLAQSLKSKSLIFMGLFSDEECVKDACTQKSVRKSSPLACHPLLGQHVVSLALLICPLYLVFFLACQEVIHALFYSILR